ncbi:MAG: LysR family transcriptional regulator [Hyphomicrobiales bacterium]|nr:LysR family transcriptional regulator [Hyphomicrobiales bacterium]
MANTKNPDLTLRGLRAFVAVEETGSVSDGARRIDGSSSGVSQQITALEIAVGAKLFDRRTRPMKLTPAGQMLRAHARKILQTVSDAQADLSKHKLADLPKITLAIIDDLDASLTPDLVTRLQLRFRQCFVNAYSGRSDQVVEMLQQREADICVSAIVPEDIEGFTSIPILREPFVLVTAKGLLENNKDIPTQLASKPFISYSESIPIGRTVTQHIKRLRFKAPQKFALEATRSVIAMVIQSDGWSLTTPLNLLDAERFIANIDIYRNPFPAFSRQIYMIARTAEFGDLPDQLAADCRELLSDKVIPRFMDIVPDFDDFIEIIN